MQSPHISISQNPCFFKQLSSSGGVSILHKLGNGSNVFSRCSNHSVTVMNLVFLVLYTLVVCDKYFKNWECTTNIRSFLIENDLENYYESSLTIVLCNYNLGHLTWSIMHRYYHF